MSTLRYSSCFQACSQLLQSIYNIWTDVDADASTMMSGVSASSGRHRRDCNGDKLCSLLVHSTSCPRPAQTTFCKATASRQTAADRPLTLSVCVLGPCTWWPPRPTLCTSAACILAVPLVLAPCNRPARLRFLLFIDGFSFFFFCLSTCQWQCVLQKHEPWPCLKHPCDVVSGLVSLSSSSFS